VKAILLFQKHVKVSNTTVYDTEVIPLMQAKNFDADSLMTHRLAALPPSTLKEAGEIRNAKTKSIPKKSGKVKFSK